MLKKNCWVNWLFAAMVAFLAVISVSSTLSGCGNKGDLYLPENASAVPTSNKNPVKKN